LGDTGRDSAVYNASSKYAGVMQRKMFWIIFAMLGLIADFTLPFWWAVAATFPILALSWWIAYRSDWF